MEDQKWDVVKNLDLSSVKEKFLSRKGFWWKLRNDADNIENEYRQFLFLIASNRGKTVVPWSQNLDDFWHEHILDTKKYQDDCQSLFGEFIHHNPHLPKGTTAHDNATADTRQMYRDTFKRQRRTDRESVSGVILDDGFVPVFCSACAVVSVHHFSSVPSYSTCGSSAPDNDSVTDGGVATCGSDNGDSGDSGSSASCGGGSSCSSCGSSCSSCGGD